MKSSALLVFVLGIWFGSTAFMFVAVNYSFSGIETALTANKQLQDRAGIKTEEEGDANRINVLYVFAGEYKRRLFRDWNRAQIVLAIVTLLLALGLNPKKSVVLPLIVAALAVLAMTFYLAPELTVLGRELDFVPRTMEAEKFERLDLLHDSYKMLELGKAVLLLLAGFFALTGSRKPGEKV